MYKVQFLAKLKVRFQDVVVQGVYACIDRHITENPRRQTGDKLNENSMFC